MVSFLLRFCLAGGKLRGGGNWIGLIGVRSMYIGLWSWVAMAVGKKKPHFKY